MLNDKLECSRGFNPFKHNIDDYSQTHAKRCTFSSTQVRTLELLFDLFKLRLSMMFDKTETVGTVFSVALPVGFRMILRVICSGATCIMIPEEIDFEQVVDTIKRHEVWKKKKGILPCFLRNSCNITIAVEFTV